MTALERLQLAEIMLDRAILRRLRTSKRLQYPDLRYYSARDDAETAAARAEFVAAGEAYTAERQKVTP